MGYLRFLFFGANTTAVISLIGLGKASVVTESNVANWVGWNGGASLFGFELWIVRRKAKGEQNETEGRHERNGMNGNTLAWVAEAGG